MSISKRKLFKLIEEEYTNEERFGSLNIYYPPATNEIEGKEWINRFGPLNSKNSGEADGKSITFLNYINILEKLYVEVIVEKDIAEFIMKEENSNIRGVDPDQNRIDQIMKQMMMAYNDGAKLLIKYTAKNDAHARKLLHPYGGHPVKQRMDLGRQPKTVWVTDLPEIGARALVIVD